MKKRQQHFIVSSTFEAIFGLKDLVHENDVGTDVEYRGEAFGPFPKGMDFVMLHLLSVNDNVAWLSSTGGEMVFGVLSKDCYPHWYIETKPSWLDKQPPIDSWSLTPVERTRPDSWTK